MDHTLDTSENAVVRPSDYGVESARNRFISQVRRVADSFGVCLSVLCLVHCLLTPVVFFLLPSLSVLELGMGKLGLLHTGHDEFHHLLLILFPLSVLAAFIPGYLRHKNKSVFAWGGLGLLFAATGTLAFEDLPYFQLALTIPGSLFLIRAHLLNRRLCSCCRAGH